MDIRLEFLGGEVGVTNTELNLMPNSNRGGIHALGDALTNGNNAILQGVNAVVGAGNVTFSDGFVFLDGEVLKVDAGTVNDTEGNNLYIFQRSVNNSEPLFERNYGNGTTNNVAEIIRAQVVSVASVGGGDLPVDGTTAVDIIQSDFAVNDQNSPAFIRNKPKGFNVINVGQISNIDPNDGNFPPTYPFQGDIAAVNVLTQGDDAVVFRITFDNPAPNLNYYIRSSVEIITPSGADDDVFSPVFFKENTSQVQMILGNNVDVNQNLRLFVEMVIFE